MECARLSFFRITGSVSDERLEQGRSKTGCEVIDGDGRRFSMAKSILGTGVEASGGVARGEGDWPIEG